MIKSNLYYFLIFVLVGIFSCNNPEFIDTDIVNVDILDIVVDDDFDVSAFTMEEDSVESYSPGITRSLYPFGIADDPIFGRSTAMLVVQPFLNTTSPPSFDGAVVDSVIMEIALSPDQPFYGDTTGVVGIEVFELTEVLDPIATYSSSFEVTTAATPIGIYQGIPNFTDSMSTFRILGDTIFTDVFPAHLRIPLDNEYGERIINSGDVLNSFGDFIDNFNGLQLRPTNTNEGLIAFDLRNFVSGRGLSVNGATFLIFYTIDGIQRQFNLVSNLGSSIKLAQYEQDYDGSPVEESIEEDVLGDDLFFAQGMTGANAGIRLNDVVERLEGSLINGAILEVYGTTSLSGVDGELDDLRPVPPQLELRSFQNGELVLIRDFQSAEFAGSLAFSGGDAVNMGDGIYKYTFDIVSELQDIIEEESPNEFFIRVSNKVGTMNRIAFFGPDHSTHPITLTVTYTNL